MKRFLVIGGTGVAGSAAISAVRSKFGDQAHVTVVWYGRKEEDISIDGADTVLFGDISDPACWDAIESASGKQFDTLFYATAMGEVGFPASMATPEQIADSNRLSFDPLPRLEERFDCGTIVSYSTFFNLAHQLVTYGAMAHSKAAIEEWTAQSGTSRRRCIRAGAFTSGSSMAIKLLVRRNAAKLASLDDPILKEHFNGVKPSEAVETLQQAVFDEERETYGDTGTGQDSLTRAHEIILDGTDSPFVCVCGKKTWLDDTPQEAPVTREQSMSRSS